MAWMRTVAPPAATFLVGMAWVGALTLSPQPGEPMAAIYPPSVSPAAAMHKVVAAGADAILSVGASRSILIAQSADAFFAKRLRESGAILVVRASIDGYCK